MNPAQQRCWQTLGVVEKEAFHLRDVAGRLFDAPELAAVGEKTGTALEKLHRAERLQLLADPDQWLSMRQLRNRLVHE